MGNPHRDRNRRDRRGGDRDFSNNGVGDALQRRYGQIDVSLDGVRQREQHDRRDHGGGQPRPRLEFRELATLESGYCRCRVTGAEGHGGMIYNFSLERSARERPSRFFRETDADDVKRLVEQATAWIREHA